MNNNKVDELLALLAETGNKVDTLGRQIVCDWALKIYLSGYDTGHYFGHSDGWEEGYNDGIGAGAAASDPLIKEWAREQG